MCAAGSSAQVIPIDNGSFSIEYDTILMVPRSVVWILQPSDLGRIQREPSWRFTADPLCRGRQASHDDFRRSGYDRGHMCPAADRSRDISSMKQTFVITNVCPQAPALNRGPWKRDEIRTRSYVLGGHKIRVMACPVYWRADTQLIGSSRVAVPHGFTKTIFADGSDSVIYARYYNNQ